MFTHRLVKLNYLYRVENPKRGSIAINLETGVDSSRSVDNIHTFVNIDWRKRENVGRIGLNRLCRYFGQEVDILCVPVNFLDLQV